MINNNLLLRRIKDYPLVEIPKHSCIVPAKFAPRRPITTSLTQSQHLCPRNQTWRGERYRHPNCIHLTTNLNLRICLFNLTSLSRLFCNSMFKLPPKCTPRALASASLSRSRSSYPSTPPKSNPWIAPGAEIRFVPWESFVSDRREGPFGGKSIRCDGADLWRVNGGLGSSSFDTSGWSSRSDVTEVVER